MTFLYLSVIALYLINKLGEFSVLFPHLKNEILVLLQTKFASLAYHRPWAYATHFGYFVVLGGRVVPLQYVQHILVPEDSGRASVMLHDSSETLVVEDAVGLLAVPCILIRLLLSSALYAKPVSGSVLQFPKLPKP